MENEARHSSILPLSVLILAFGLGGIYLYDQPYSSLRPEEVVGATSTRSTTETVGARLWEDPFEAVARTSSASPCTDWSFASADGNPDRGTPASGDGETGDARGTFLAFQETASRQLIQLAYEVGRRSRATSPTPEAGGPRDRVLLMPVLVPGEPYFEQAETRRRLRYAVLSGLGESGFVPESSGHLGVVDVCWDFSGRLDPSTGRPMPMPYEWFVADPLRRTDRRLPSVLVLWLNEGEVGGDPWNRIEDVLGHLVGYRAPSADRIDGFYSFRLIGPASSDVLAAMLKPRRSPAPSARPAAETDTEQPPADGEGTGVTEAPEAVSMLLLVATMYLDDPAQLFGEEGERAEELERALKPVVEAVLAREGRRELAASDLVDPIASALQSEGPGVEDSDPLWYRTVPVWWLRLLDEESARSGPLGRLAELGESLCLELARDEEECKVSGRDVDALDQGRVCSSFENLAGRLSCQLSRKQPKFKNSISLSEWMGELASALRREALGEAHERELGVSREQVPEIVSRWIVTHHFELIGSLEPPGPILPHLTIYNNRATAAASVLLEGAFTGSELTGLGPASSERRLQAALARAALPGDVTTGPPERTLRFEPVVLTDDTLVSLLVDELTRRGVDLCTGDGEHHLALIGEWDTFYGRALPLTLEAEIVRCRAERKRQRPEDGGDGEEASDEPLPTLDDSLVALMRGTSEPPGRIERYQYLRGLDGVAASSPSFVAGKAPGTSSTGPSTGGLGVSEWLPWNVTQRLERSRGNRQFDYMRRLADQLSARQQEIRRRGGELRAIGVVGTDAYDKMLVLQALRTRFPRTLFFTTDLDSRMFHPADFRWNRNMLVASSFGLRLHPEIQPNAPPFRDSYQTATFLAVRLAIDQETKAPPAVEAEAEPLGRMARASFPPAPSGRRSAPEMRPVSLRLRIEEDPKPMANAGARLYEIGRAGPYEITPEKRSKKGRQLHPMPPDSRPSPRALGMIAALSSLGICLLIPVVPGLRRFTLGRWSETGSRERLAANLFTLLILLTLALFAWLVYRATGDPGGEPFALWHGISIWPTEAIRLAAALLALFFVSFGAARLARNEDDLARRYGLSDGPRAHRPGCWSRWWRATSATGEESRGPGRFVARLRARRAAWWRERIRVSINAWRCASGGDREASAEGAAFRSVDGNDVWDRYRYLGRFGHRMTRVLPVALLYLVLGRLLIILLGEPHVPHRDGFSSWADFTILMTGVVLTILLTFFVVDATRLCERFIDALAERPTKWSDEVEQRMAERRHVDPRDVGDVIDLELIGDRTEVVGNLILYPFVVLFLMIVSRASVFDNWDWPAGLLLILGLSSAYALMCAVVLRRAAERARRKTIEHLRTNLHQAIAEEKGPEGPRSAQIRLLIEEAQALRRGAFAHWTHHPVVKAVLLPFSGVGVLALIELLSVMGR